MLYFAFVYDTMFETYEQGSVLGCHFDFRNAQKHKKRYEK